MADDYLVSEFNGIKLAWSPELDGGGRGFGQDYVPLVRHLFGKVGRLAEFCAGPAYIGFSLLAHDCCEHLVLIDVNPRAIDAIHETIRMNGLAEKVTVYLSDGLGAIPPTERWDLVVANPPHFREPVGDVPSIITDDPGWRVHRDFYGGVGGFLTPGGSVLVQENSEGSAPEDFLQMIEDGGLTHTSTLWYGGGQAGPGFYYLWSRKALPGLVFDPGVRPADLKLGPGGGQLLDLDPRGPWALRLVNLTGRPVRPRLTDDAGQDQFWLPFGELGTESATELPRMALRPGGYQVRDETSGTVLARIRVS
ncbi:methyltransferase [Streptosporangium fragile]